MSDEHLNAQQFDLYRGLHGEHAAQAVANTRAGRTHRPRSGDWYGSPDLAVQYAEPRRHGQPSGVIIRGRLHPEAKVLDADSREARKAEKSGDLTEYARQRGYHAIRHVATTQVLDLSKVEHDPRDYKPEDYRYSPQLQRHVFDD